MGITMHTGDHSTVPPQETLWHFAMHWKIDM